MENCQHKHLSEASSFNIQFSIQPQLLKLRNCKFPSLLLFRSKSTISYLAKTAVLCGCWLRGHSTCCAPGNPLGSVNILDKASELCFSSRRSFQRARSRAGSLRDLNQTQAAFSGLHSCRAQKDWITIFCYIMQQTPPFQHIFQNKYWYCQIIRTTAGSLLNTASKISAFLAPNKAAH